MSIIVSVRGKPPQAGAVGTNDVDLQAVEPMAGRDGVTDRIGLAVALEYDPAGVARPVTIIVESVTTHQRPEPPAFHVEDREVGAPAIEWAQSPDIGVAAADGENDGIT